MDHYARDMTTDDLVVDYRVYLFHPGWIGGCGKVRRGEIVIQYHFHLVGGVLGLPEDHVLLQEILEAPGRDESHACDDYQRQQ